MKKFVVIGLFALGAIGGLSYCTMGGSEDKTKVEQTESEKEKSGEIDEKTTIDSTQKDSNAVKDAEKKAEDKPKTEAAPTEKKDDKKVEKK
jgi:maltose-binding protein MalE